MTPQIIVFIGAILLGIVWYWRESKSNYGYRLANKITHAKKLQMTPENKKGFVYLQPFLLRLVWVTLFFAIGAGLVTFLIPFDMFYIQYFASSIVATLIGTYLASAFFVVKETTNKENLDKVLDKGKEIIDDFVEEVQEKTEDQPEITKQQTKEVPEKTESARDRLRNKGMIK